MYEEAGNNKAAKQAYLQAMKDNPRDLMSMQSVAYIYLNEGNEKAAFPSGGRIDAANHSRAVAYPKPVWSSS